MGNRGAVNTGSGRGASTTRGQFRERLDALELARHTRKGALFVTSRAEVENNRLARPQSEMAFSGVPSAGEVTFVAFAVFVLVLVIIVRALAFLVVIFIFMFVVGFIRRMRGRRGRLGWLGTAALGTQG